MARTRDEEKIKPSVSGNIKTASESSLSQNQSITQSEKKSTKDGRYRNWTIVVYPESAPEDWRDNLNGMQWVESPLHDKDLNADGTPKKPHWHIMILFDGKKSYEQVKEIADSLNGASPQYVQHITGMIRYFAHLDNPEKVQYDKSKIIGHGVDVLQYLETENDIDQRIQDIEIYAEENHISEYAKLVKLSRQFEGWHKTISTHTIHFKAFLNSLRHGGFDEPAEVPDTSDLASQALNQEEKK